MILNSIHEVTWTSTTTTKKTGKANFEKEKVQAKTALKHKCKNPK